MNAHPVARIINEAFEELLTRIEEFRENDNDETFDEETFKGYDEEIKELGFWALYYVFDGEIECFNFENHCEDTIEIDIDYSLIEGDY